MRSDPLYRKLQTRRREISAHRKASEPGTLLVEPGVAEAVLPAKLWYWAAGFGLLDDGNDLAVGKAGGLHVELFVS